MTTHAEGDNKVVAALLGIPFGVQKEAADFICTCIAAWTHTPFFRGHTLPRFKDGQCIQPSFPTLTGDDPPEVMCLLNAWELESRTAIAERIERMNALQSAVADVRKSLSNMCYLDSGGIEIVALRHYGDVNQRVVSALGLHAALTACLDGASSSVERILLEERHKLGRLKAGRGRERSEAIYCVTREFAKIYNIVTGRVPTFAANDSGLHGEFTPCLGKLFDIFGWSDRSMKRPAGEAIKALRHTEVRPNDAGPIGDSGSILPSYEN